MSELKATSVYDAYWTANSVGEGTGVLVYLKSEVNKVIADLDSRNAQLRKDKANLLRNNENLKLEIKTQKLGRLNDKIQYQITERHHKYKRCLAKAEVEWLKRMILCNHPESISFRRAVKREHKWEALADKFKEAK